MKISKILKSTSPGLSFEVFPPKKEGSFDSVRGACESIAALKPSFVSVTYGAGGTTDAYTLALAKAIKTDTGTEVLPHLTCVGASLEDIDRQLDAMTEQGFENIMALRGDMREDIDSSAQAFSHADELVSHIRGRVDFCIGGACYPECHPESESVAKDIEMLRRKADAGVDFLTTQMFFDNNLFFNFMYKLLGAGVTVPVLPGIMPVTKAKQLARINDLSQAFLPRRFIALVDRFGSDERAMKQAGIAYATDQIIDLFANGINHVHVYTMNDPEVASAIMSNLSNIVNSEL